MIDFLVLLGLIIGVARIPGLSGWALHGSSGRLVVLALPVWLIYCVAGVGLVDRTVGGFVTHIRTVSISDGGRPGIRAALVRWPITVASVPFLVLPFFGEGIYWKFYALRLRMSRTIDILEEDYRELMAFDLGPRRRRLGEYAGPTASSPPMTPSITMKRSERPQP